MCPNAGFSGPRAYRHIQQYGTDIIDLAHLLCYTEFYSILIEITKVFSAVKPENLRVWKRGIWKYLWSVLRLISPLVTGRVNQFSEMCY